MRVKIDILAHLEFLWDTPSSTQQRLVFWSPTSTTQALLKPLPNVAHTDSWCTMMAIDTKRLQLEDGTERHDGSLPCPE